MSRSMTRVALATYRLELVKESPDFDERQFLFHLSRSEYEKEWGKDYRKPGLCARIFGWLTRWIPKAGPAKALAVQIPTRETEDLYIKSINKTVAIYRDILRELASGHVELPNVDFDTGKKPEVGEYVLADKTYARWLDELASRGFLGVSPEIQQELLLFYSQQEQAIEPAEGWRKIEHQLKLLKTLEPK